MFAAGLHFILTFGPDQKVAHATEALDLAQHVYARAGETPSNTEKRDQDAYMEDIRERIKQAQEKEIRVPSYTLAKLPGRHRLAL